MVVFTVEAIQLTPNSVKDTALWCGGYEIEQYDAIDRSKKFVGLNIPTMEGVKRASETDYVVKEATGTFSVMSQREFESKYELVV
jgi:hypothetical protein